MVPDFTEYTALFQCNKNDWIIWSANNFYEALLNNVHIKTNLTLDIETNLE